jgi:hypothetical protein
MRRIFAVLLQTIFQRAISLFHWRLAKRLTMSSGIEVPKATIVRPITRLEIPSFFAREEAPRTRISAQKINIARPKIRERRGKSIMLL